MTSDGNDDHCTHEPEENAGDGHNLSKPVMVISTWNDQHGIHQAFFAADEMLDGVPAPEQLARAQFINTYDPLGALFTAWLLQRQALNLLANGAPPHWPVGAPIQFGRNARQRIWGMVEEGMQAAAQAPDEAGPGLDLHQTLSRRFLEDLDAIIGADEGSSGEEAAGDADGDA